MMTIVDNPIKHNAALERVRALSENRLEREPDFIYKYLPRYEPRVQWQDEPLSAVELSRRVTAKARKLQLASPHRRVKH